MKGPIRSRKYLDGARGAPCTLMMPGCDGGGETTVACHVRDRHAGRAQKANDLFAVDGCHQCHERFDRRAKMPNGEYISDANWLFYALRAVQLTQERRVELGLLRLDLDAEKPLHERPTTKRKPPEHRTKIVSRKTAWPKREFQSRSKP